MSDQFATLTSTQIKNVVGGKAKAPAKQPVIGLDATNGLGGCLAQKLGLKLPALKGIDYRNGTAVPCSTHEKIGKVLSKAKR